MKRRTGEEATVWSRRSCPIFRLMMIAAAFLVLLRPYSIQCVLLLLLLLLGTIATILFFCCWHRRLRNGKHPMKSVLSGGRSRSRGEYSAGQPHLIIPNCLVYIIVHAVFCILALVINRRYKSESYCAVSHFKRMFD